MLMCVFILYLFLASYLDLASFFEFPSLEWSLSQTHSLYSFVIPFTFKRNIIVCHLQAVMKNVTKWTVHDFSYGSFSLLWGPMNHMRHLCSNQRLPFTSAYFGSMFLTLYAALWVKSTALTAVGAVVQIIALLWYIASSIPGGQTGLHFFTGLFTTAVKRGVSSALPV
uniref:Vesicle transport protein n=1 Tax=Eptatretus burgeri TaxID=7764 RepID=A0A8C4QUV4_EPTBU